MNKQPKISIVIPSFNKVNFIGNTLLSIVKQNYKNLEIIIQDGGSTDGTVEIIKKYAKRYPGYIKWESKNDKGQLDAVKKGMEKSSGQILTFINADDQYLPNALTVVSETASKNSKALWFAGRSIVINEKGYEIAKPVKIYKNFLLNLNEYFFLLTTNYLMQPSVFFTKEAYKKYGPFNGTSDFIMEYDFWLKLGAVSMPVVIPKTISKFLIESTTKTKTMSNRLLKEDKKIVKKYTSNLLILFLHDINNLARTAVARFV